MSGVGERTREYLREGPAAVHGWLHRDSAEVIASLARAQESAALRGNAAEIGIHHGRLFLLLALCVTEGERAVALDVFGDQDRNLDRSGLGDRAVFQANLARWTPAAPVDVVQASSLDVDVDQAVETFGRVRLFSVDGGHTEDAAAHDLALAQACLVPGGVVVLDDPLNPYWLGVVSGLVRYRERGGTLRAFAYSENKLYLTTDAEAASGYRRHLRRDQASRFGKANVPLLGDPIDVYVPGLEKRWELEEGLAEEVRRLRRRVRRLRAKVAELEARI